MKQTSQMWRYTLLIPLLFCLLTASGQWKKKGYTEWSEEDARKLLQDSPWAKKTEIFFRSGPDPLKPDMNPSSGMPGYPNPPLSTPIGRRPPGQTITLYVQFISAKPVLEAYRRAKLTDSEEIVKQVESLNSSGEQYMIISVVAKPRLFKLSKEDVLKTFLEIDGKQRVYPKDHLRIGVNTNAFVFPRIVDAKPIMMSEAIELRFHTSLRKELIVVKVGEEDKQVQIEDIDVKFKARDMVFEGKPDY